MYQLSWTNCIKLESYGYSSSTGLLQRCVVQPLAPLHPYMMDFLSKESKASKIPSYRIHLLCCTFVRAAQRIGGRALLSDSPLLACAQWVRFCLPRKYFHAGYNRATFPKPPSVFHVLNLTNWATVCVYLYSRCINIPWLPSNLSLSPEI